MGDKIESKRQLKRDEKFKKKKKKILHNKWQ